MTAAASSTLTLVDLEGSRSKRILWLLEEFGLPYRLDAFGRAQCARFRPLPVSAA